MKFTVQKKELVRAFSIAESVTAKKGMMPVLANVKIDAGERLTFSGTDLTLSAVSIATATIATRGSVLVPANQFLAAARAMPEGEIVVQTKDARVEIANGKSKQRVGFASVDDYPMILGCPDGGLDSANAAALARAIGSVAHAASQDEARSNLAGVQVTFEDGRCFARASNGHVYARRSEPCEPFRVSALLPVQSLRDVRRALELADGNVRIGERSGYVFVVSDDVTISAKLTGEKFPNTDQLVPTKFVHRVRVAREPLLDAVKRVMTAADDPSKSIEFTFGDGSIGMRLDSSKGDASASDEVSCDYAGDGITIGMRGSYTIAALSALESADVVIEMNRNIDPIRFVPADAGDHLQLIMPTKL